MNYYATWTFIYYVGSSTGPFFATLYIDIEHYYYFETLNHCFYLLRFDKDQLSGGALKKTTLERKLEALVKTAIFSSIIYIHTYKTQVTL